MISKRQFADEFAELAHRAGIRDTCAVEFPKYMSQRHRRTGRSFAEVEPWKLYFAFAEEILGLDEAHRQAVLMHEFGHVLCRDLPGGGTEDDADRAAERAFGVRIVYDRRWPGKGLQRVMGV